MLMVVTNDGKEYFLGCLFGNGPDPLDDYSVRLFKNDYTPVDASVTADFTQADFGGYAAVGISQGAMDPPVIVANVGEQSFNGPPTYTCDSGADQWVYGWYMIGQNSGKTYLAQRFDEPRLMTVGAIEVLNPFTIRLKTFDG